MRASSSPCLAGIFAVLIAGIVWICSVRASTLVELNVHIPVSMLVLPAVLGVVIGNPSPRSSCRAARLDPL